MVIAHFTSTIDSSNILMDFLATVHGRASLSFVFVAGLGVGLLDRAKGPKESGYTLLWRAVILVPMGIVLQEVSPGPIIILQFYAVYYLVGWVGARLPTWALAVAIPVWTGVGCYIWWLGEPQLVIGNILMSPAAQLKIILYNGQYPVITWGPMVLLGVLISRFNLRDRMVQLYLAGASCLVIVAVHIFLGFAVQSAGVIDQRGLPGWLILEHHSNSITYLVEGYASAVFMVSLCLLIGQYWGKLGEWLAIAGRQALTLYVVHLFWYQALNGLFDTFYFTSPIYTEDLTEAAYQRWEMIFLSVPYIGAFTCFLFLVIQAVIWHNLFGMGPLERLLRRPGAFRA